MKGATKTRTQRRLEKRQAIILLVLVLAVSLASFTLGVIVGRRGAERDLAYKLKQTEKVLVAQTPAPVATPIPVPDKPEAAEAPAADPATEETKLSFYDDLSKETVPLGSGINLDPNETPKEPETAAQPPIDLPDQPIVKKGAETVVAAVAPAKEQQAPAVSSVSKKTSSALPKVAAKGHHAVQIGSFNSAKDAIALKQKMLDKQYPAFVVEADLGKKGLWYRVRIGPYADSASAKQAQKLLEEKEQIKGFVSRQ